MTDVGVVDAHHHLWDPAHRSYPWLSGEQFTPIRRRYGLPELAAALAGTPVEATVLVQTVGERSETEEFLSTAQHSAGLIAGVVGWVDLTSDEVAEELAALRDRPGGVALVGIRHQVESEADPDWLARADVRRGLRAVADAGLVYDLLIRPDQLSSARDVVRALPDLRFVLDHGGKPPIRTGGPLAPGSGPVGGSPSAAERWSAELGELAEAENVMVKLSGLITEASWTRWTVADIRPYGDRLLTAFGADRLIFGSDWPVCELAGDYGRVLSLARELCVGLSADERTEVLAANARRWYRLGGS
ncbi:amidohydrolase family protein [Actinoalloteichus hymeniacidonis]|uniref:TIM-barrel fold metal-dependent hydrolase n=1 Tax=Actinoalloteichus hymeniacidonis TaxID=340345 RepID=A0AAC9HPF0_9PSEU|nr:amidohydrolase family protein [Actinoalloteichus hymeniacidonis]AOS63052.1 putative TIM-barrel fold metal-dependent hydrolase [Actinoalloteichus hymeniacidonis]MBB5908913.1 L-fuconolactonase [Actinoalloteichus hymeniacidonis]